MTALLNSEFLILAAVFGCIVLLGVVVVGFLSRDAGAERIESVRRGGGNADQLDAPEAVSLLYDDDRPTALRMLEPFQRIVAQSDPKQVTAARARLIEAGFYRRTAVETYFTSRLILGIGMAIMMAVYILIFPPQLSAAVKMFAVVAATATGFYLPALLVSLRIRSRQRAFKRGMPDALDMMLVGVEAGLSLSAAMKHIVKEFAIAHPIVAEQFQIITLEFQAGRSRSDALNGLATRMNLPVTRTLASMIVQSEQLGTSLSTTLRVMAQELRTQRMLEAEKIAAELPVKMSVPLVLFIFPALMAVALVPAMISTLNFFASI